MAAPAASNGGFVFVFPMASGHINPSLPIARELVKRGYAVRYLCREQMRGPIEDTGASLDLDSDVYTELYYGRKADIFGAHASLMAEHGLDGESSLVGRLKLEYVQIELMLPGLLRYLEEHKPLAVVYDPLACREAAVAAKVGGIPSLAVLTTAGPGSMAHIIREMLAKSGQTVEEVCTEVGGFAPRAEALRRLQENYGYVPSHPMSLDPVGMLPVLGDSEHVLVTTIEELQDAVPAELREAYDAVGASFVSVGALLGEAGAVRAAGHKLKDHAVEHSARDSIDVVARVREAREEGKRVILVSMGTVITGDHSEFGWNARPLNNAGQPAGLTGQALCHAAWAGSFDAFGDDEQSLIVVSLGPQPNALEGLAVPSNAICMPAVPQVDILKAGVDVFVTHGGQNSFTEALASGTPVVVCPGFADQPMNARKAVSLGVGLKVDRPQPASGEEPAAAAAYRAEVRHALLDVVSAVEFTSAAQCCAEALRCAGGVDRAVETVLDTASGPAVVPKSPSFGGA